MIPEKIFEALSRLVMGAKEWRILMIILSRTFGSKKSSAEVSLDDFVEATKIKKPHVSHATSNLMDRNLLNRTQYYDKKEGLISIYSLQQDSSRWRSILSIKLPNGLKEQYNEDFEKFFERYPNPIYEEDTRILYLNLMSDGVKPSEIEDALTGYIKNNLYRCEKFNQDPDDLLLMYPTNFLRNDKWRDFLKFKGMRRRPKL